MRVYLIGFMGSGKSHWGHRLAGQLHWPFFDLDAQIEAAEGKPVAEIFRHSGEARFRELEAEQLRSTVEYPDAVIATGGGTPCFSDNMAWMNAHGRTIFLDTPAEVLVTRLWPEQQQRPLLEDLPEDDLLSFVREKLQAREVFYRQAHVTINCAGEDEELLEKMIAAIV